MTARPSDAAPGAGRGEAPDAGIAAGPRPGSPDGPRPVSGHPVASARSRSRPRAAAAAVDSFAARTGAPVAAASADSPFGPADDADATPARWSDPVLVVAILAVAPEGLGVHLRAPPGPALDAWLALLRAALPADRPLLRCPPGIGDDRLLGGLDPGATLLSRRRIVGRGLLPACDRGVLLLPMAGRVAPDLAARLGGALDHGELVLERDSVAAILSARFALVALDDGLGDDPPPPAALLDRLAFGVSGLPASAPQCFDRSGDPQPAAPDGFLATLEQARARLPAIQVPEAVAEALCRTALLAGILSLRAPLLALRAARIVAALCGHDRVEDADAAIAARLVLAPRAVMRPDLPAPPGDEGPDPVPPSDPHAAAAPSPSADPRSGPPAPASQGADEPGSPQDADAAGPPPSTNPANSPPGADPAAARHGASGDDRPGADTAGIVLRAVRAAVAPDLLDRLRPMAAASPAVASTSAAGRTEAGRSARRPRARRGRPLGALPGDPSRGRLDLLATLRAALPWQALRRAAGDGLPDGRVRVRREDLRLRRFAPRLQLVTLFLVDASGSAARARLAEAKGCVSILLADCYARRDRVALLAVRDREATLVLPPTGSVVRARRALDGLPGGGGTPLAAGLDAVARLAERIRRDGAVPLLVLLTDGRANVARDGAAGRERAMRDALDSAARLRASGLPSLLVDISPRARRGAAPEAEALAGALGARCLLLSANETGTMAREAAALAARQR